MGVYTEDAYTLVTEILNGEFLKGTETHVLRSRIERYEATLKSNKGRRGLEKECEDIRQGLIMLRNAL